MLKSPGLVGRVGSGIASLASVLGGAAAAATTYLLRALFGGANQSLANTDVLTDEKGTLTNYDVGGGTLSIASGKMKLDPLNNNANIVNSWYSGITTVGAGDVFIVEDNFPETAATGSWSTDFGFLTALPTTQGAFLKRRTDFGGHKLDLNAGGYWELTSSDLQLQFAQDNAWAVVAGGFTSGVPDPTGVEGSAWYVKYGANDWRLIAVEPSTTWGNRYLYSHAYESSTSTRADASIITRGVYHPTAVDTTPFTPTGYALDTFTDTNGTLITAHTGDATFDWSAASQWGSKGVMEINTNAARGQSSGTSFASTDISLSDFFLTATGTRSGASGLAQFGVVYRVTNSANHWILYSTGDAGNPDWYLDEVTSGVQTTRASGNVAPGLNSTLSLRCSGTTHEGWMNGGGKLSYTSASHQTATGCGVYSNNDGTNWGRVNSLIVLPLTSATYNTAFDTSALTKDDCDLYHTFDSIPDVTFANGAVIRDGYVTDGSLTVTDSSTGALAVSSNKLVHTGTAATLGATGVLGNSYTKAAGLLTKADITLTSGGSPWRNTAQIHASSTSVAPYTNAMYYVFLAADSTGGTNEKIEFTNYATPGSGGRTYVINPTVGSGTHKLAIVSGGFDSAGVPDATGTYGHFVYSDIGSTGTWTLVACDPQGNQATNYPGFFSNVETGSGTNSWDDILLPDSGTTVESVFTPVGYSLDNFTDSDGTGLVASHTADTGESWEGVSTALINSNQVYINSGASINNNVAMDVGSTDVLLCTSQYYNGGIWTRVLLRYVDNNNYWEFLSYGPNTIIYEMNAGVRTQRAITTSTVSSGTKHTCRFSGNTLECWHEGTDKVSYGSASAHSTSTKHGLGLYGTTTYYCDWFYVLPLTSTTYADLDL